jgi:hypothetical protein
MGARPNIRVKWLVRESTRVFVGSLNFAWTLFNVFDPRSNCISVRAMNPSMGTLVVTVVSVELSIAL